MTDDLRKMGGGVIPDGGPHTLRLIESRNFMGRLLREAFGVPEEIMGTPETSNFEITKPATSLNEMRGTDASDIVEDIRAMVEEMKNPPRHPVAIEASEACMKHLRAFTVFGPGGPKYSRLLGLPIEVVDDADVFYRIRYSDGSKQEIKRGGTK